MGCDYKGTLHIEKVSSDRWYDFYTVEGMTIEDMNYVLSGNGDGKKREDRLMETMDKYDNDSWYGHNIGSAWRWGYGIYSVRHIGGHLLIEVGNNCD